MSEQPSESQKDLRRPTDVCAELDIQPYVLKFWESEFPQLGRRIGPKRNYGPDDVAIVREIHRLLEEDGLSLGEARAAIGRAFPDETAPTDAPEAAPASAEVVRRLDETALELQAARGELAEARARIEELEGAAARRDELEGELAELRTELADRTEDASHVAELDVTLAHAREEHAAALAAVRAEVEQERARLLALQDELRRAWDENGPLRKDNTRLEGELSAAQEQLHAVAATIQELRTEAARAEEMTQLAAGLRSQLADAEALFEQAENERVRTAQDLAQMTHRAEESARLAADGQHAVDQLAVVRAEREELQSRFEELATKFTGLERERDELRQAIAEGEERAPRLERRLTEVEAERDEYRRRVRQEVGAALERVRGVTAAAEELALAIGAASVVPDRLAPKGVVIEAAPAGEPLPEPPPDEPSGPDEGFRPTV